MKMIAEQGDTSRAALLQSRHDEPSSRIFLAGRRVFYDNIYRAVLVSSTKSIGERQKTPWGAISPPEPAIASDDL